MARGSFGEAHLPEDIQIPKEIVRGLDRAYHDLLASGGYERGGNIVKKYGAGYEMRQGGSNHDDVGDSAAWDPNRDDVGVG